MLLKNKLLKSTLSIFLVLMLIISSLPITASAAELDVVDIEIAPIAIVENTNGNYEYDYNPETYNWDLEYFCYEPEYIMEYTVTLKDGTTIESNSTYFIYNNEYYYLSTETNQSYKNQWTVGNTYNMTVSYGNISTDVPVTITENPFESIEVNPISIIEHTNGYIAHDYNYETDEWDLEYFCYEPEYIMEYTVTLKDGTTIKGNDTWFEYEGSEFNLNISTDQSYENQWTVGNTYNMTVSLGNISTDVPVTIAEIPFESIEAKPISITEYTNGYIAHDYNSETDDYDLEYFYYEPENIMEYTITLKDGTTIKGNDTWFEYEGIEFDLDISTDQSYENQWTVGNTYNMTVSVGNISTDVPVTITESPFESIEVNPISITEHTNGYVAHDYNPETDDYDLEYFYYEPEYIMEYTVTLKDGTTIKDTGTWFEYEGTEFNFDTSTDQFYENQWTVGNTYNMTVSLSNISINVPVTITENPFESIEVNPITIIEYTNGDYEHDYNPETDDYDLEYFCYEPESVIEYTITLNDGTTIEDTGIWLEYEGNQFTLDISTDQSYENQWTVGNTYNITVSVGNTSTDVPVTITENPFESIEVKPITITEHTYGSYEYDYNPETDDYDLEYFYYDPENAMEYTITLKDGTTIEDTGIWFEYEGNELALDVSTDQSYKNPWTTGNTYNMTVSYGKTSTNVPVTITENPFKSIEVKPITITDHTYGYYEYDYNPETNDYDLEYFYYEPESVMEYTITLKDGTTIEDTGIWFEYEGNEYGLSISTDQSYENQWTVGNTYNMTVSYSNISTNVPVTITELPFESIEVKPITITACTNGYYKNDYNPETDDYDLEYFYYNPEDVIEYTITLKDGTTFDGTGIWFEYEDYEFNLNISSDQSYENQWTAGDTYNMTVSVGNISTDVPVTITELPFESIEVKPITITEYTNGYYKNDYNPETDDYDLEYFCYEPEYIMEYTITLKDGTTIKDTRTWFEYEGNEFDLDISTDQSYENQWTAGNTYNMTVSVGNISTDVPVTITENPFESIEVKPISIIEHTNGYISHDYNPETDDYDLKYFHYDPEYIMEYTITLKDGTTFDGTGIRFEYEGNKFNLDISTDQAYENQWTTGNTYNMTVSLGNISTDVSVTITECPFNSIEIKPISIEEYTKGIYVDIYNPETEEYDLKYFNYKPQDEIEYTLTLKDGSTINGTGYNFEYDGIIYNFEISAYQSYYHPWTAGNTYTMRVSISNLTTDVPVTITSSKPNPTLKGDVDNDGLITIKDATLVQEHVVKYITLTDTSALNADVDGNGDINIVDATYIQLYLVNKFKDFNFI